MIDIRYETIIDRADAKVFAFIANPANDPHWCPPVLEAEQIAGDGPAKGARFRQIVKPGPKRLTNTLEITEFEPNRRMAWEGSNGMMDFHGHYEVAPVEGGTRVVMISRLEMKGLWRLLAPLISRASRDMAAEEFQNLKQLLEAEPASSGRRSVAQAF